MDALLTTRYRGSRAESMSNEQVRIMAVDPRATVLRSTINPLSPRCPRCGLSHVVWYEAMQRRVCPCVIERDKQCREEEERRNVKQGVML